MAVAATEFRLILNGEPVQLSGVTPQITLLDYVRSRGLTGAKEGCAEGECGACAVIFVRPGPRGTWYQPVNSCLVPLPAAAGQEVYTVEALASSGRLAEVQQAMVEHGGSQCGYCTPGFVVSMFAEHHRREDRPADIHALGGNLCRCTGYRPIRDALESLGPVPVGSVLAERLTRPAPAVLPFRYASGYANEEGRFSRPCNLAECLALIEADESGRFVAGNTDLGVMTNLRDRRFPHLISLEGTPELREFRDGPDGVEIGAALTLSEIGGLWENAPALFREWLPLFASPLLRNRATLGGNLATASPIGDSAPMLLALDASVRLTGSGGERVVPLREFFTGYRQTSLGRCEILRSVLIPKPFPALARFYKVAKRALDDISTVAAGISLDRGSDGRISRVRFAFGGVAAVPLRAFAAEDALTGSFGSAADLKRATDIIAATLRPMSDHRGSAEYRLAMAQSLLEKFWFEEVPA
ncbi:MAG TPA: FAD binding domain-containing protein [Bryobacteraceae bacterium]|jgi:xanthine dehydrogenase small subunit|nr:FAD binding domain-containing protein [Bryobacteraceae bacterium]